MGMSCYTHSMKTLTYTFLALALYGLGAGHLGGTLLALLCAGMCWYGGKRMDRVEAVVDKDCDIVCASTLVLSAQYADNM